MRKLMKDPFSLGQCVIDNRLQFFLVKGFVDHSRLSAVFSIIDPFDCLLIRIGGEIDDGNAKLLDNFFSGTDSIKIPF